MKITKSALALSVIFLSSSLQATGKLKEIYESTDSEEQKLRSAQKHLKSKMQNKHKLDGIRENLGQQKWDLYLFAKFVKWGFIAVDQGLEFFDKNPNFGKEIKTLYNSGSLNLRSIQEEYHLQTYAGFAMNVFYSLRCAHLQWECELANQSNLEVMALSLGKLKNVLRQVDNTQLQQFINQTIKNHLKDQSGSSSGEKELIKFWRDWRKTSFAPPKDTASNLIEGW